MTVSLDRESSRRGDGSEFTATSVLLMMPKHAKTPVAVLVDRAGVPSSVMLDVFDARETFVRLRRGPNIHGLSEPYRQLSRDEYPPESSAVETVTADRYCKARFARSASVFGAPDVVVFVPRDSSGRAYRGVRIPIPSLDQWSWHRYALATETRTECTYRIADDAPHGVSRHGGSNAVRTT
jgi:hypothetical protein